VFRVWPPMGCKLGTLGNAGPLSRIWKESPPARRDVFRTPCPHGREEFAFVRGPAASKVAVFAIGRFYMDNAPVYYLAGAQQRYHFCECSESGVIKEPSLVVVTFGVKDSALVNVHKPDIADLPQDGLVKMFLAGLGQEIEVCKVGSPSDEVTETGVYMQGMRIQRVKHGMQFVANGCKWLSSAPEGEVVAELVLPPSQQMHVDPLSDRCQEAVSDAGLVAGLRLLTSLPVAEKQFLIVACAAAHPELLVQKLAFKRTWS